MALTIGWQLAIFGLTGLLIYLGVFYGVPRLTKAGVPLLYAFFGCLWLPVLLLLPLALYLFYLEGGALTAAAVAERFRFAPIPASSWLWIIAAVVATAVFDQLFEPVGKYFARFKAFAPPDYLPAPFNPLKKMAMPPQEFFGVALPGNWKLLFIFAPLHLLAMFCEELMWRGYLLPPQEALFGPWAWVFNGLLWAWLVHAVLKWHFIGMVPGMLLTPLMAQTTQSTWAALIVHAAPNALLWLLLLWGILSRPQREKGNGDCDFSYSPDRRQSESTSRFVPMRQVTSRAIVSNVFEYVDVIRRGIVNARKALSQILEIIQENRI